MTNEKTYFDMEMEQLLNTPAMEKIQLEKLKKMLQRLKVNAPFYARMFEDSKLDVDNLRSLDEYKDKIKLFNKESLKALVAECKGDLLTALDQIMPTGIDDLDYMATTTGTTGIPTPYPMTNFDIEGTWGKVLSRGAWRAGIRSSDRGLFCFALSMVIAGIPTMMGLQQLGCMMLPVGAEAKSDRILLMQKLFRGTFYIGTPSLAEYLIEQSPKLIQKEVNELGFKALVCGGEPGAGIPEVKAKLENAYGCKIFDVGAGFGFSCDHDEYQGMHSIADDFMYYELVDPDTKEPVKWEHGAKGEAVFTSLEGDGLVLIRQSLGDIHQVFLDPCPCGKSGFRYKVIGRADDMLKVKGVMVYPTHIKGVINEFVPRLTGEMRIVLDEKPPRVVPPLKVRVEYGRDVKADELPALENAIVESMSAKLKISPKILWEEHGSLERSHYKGQVFEKTYEEKE